VSASGHDDAERDHREHEDVRVCPGATRRRKLSSLFDAARATRFEFCAGQLDFDTAWS